MIIYLDSSAIVKLVQSERETAALRRFLRQHRDDVCVTSALARVEVVRAVAAGGADAVSHARRQLARVGQITLDREILDTAATLAPGTSLRSLHAIHIASALLAGSDLRAIVTYDRRMQDVAAALGVVTRGPG